MTLHELRAQWQDGALDKRSYAEQLREQHQVLNEYAAFIEGTTVAALELAHGEVTMLSRWAPARFYCDFADLGTPPTVSVAFGEYEPMEMTILLRLLESAEAFLDIGANIGWYAIHASALFPKLKVVAVEPVLATHAILTRHIALNNSAVIPVHQGVSDKAGSAVMQVPQTMAGAASLHLSREYDDELTETVSLTTLDAIAEDWQIAPDVVKIDVEGAELLVLRGGMATLERDRPAVLAEMLRIHSAAFGYHPNEILELMASLSYRCFASAGDRWQDFTTMTPETEETNFLFLHTDRHADLIDQLTAHLSS
jgi:FkbM family methyltransferase